ncbi:MAG: GNAT family N-acetyltransferase [Peptostreptococcaceae bacterium]
MMNIRCEIEEDYSIVEDIVRKSFENVEYSDNKEHNLVRRLRHSTEFIKGLSLVAEMNNEVVGYALLTKINIKDDENCHESLGLAPVSVLPEYQNKGVGKALINEAIEKSKKLGFNSIVVLGHPDYYSKFGFKKSSEFSIKAPFDVDDEVFRVLELKEGSLSNIKGTVEYSKAFSE